jgi:hypothetical protein
VTARVLSLPFAPAPALSLVVVLAVEPPAGTGLRVVAPRLLKQFLQARFPAVKSGFAHDSPLEEIGFELVVPCRAASRQGPTNCPAIIIAVDDRNYLQT